MSVLEQFMDSSLADVEAAPEYITPPSGVYNLRIEGINCKEVTLKSGQNKGKTVVCVVVTYSLLDCESTAVPGASVPEEGSLFTESFFMTETGEAYWVRFLDNVLPDRGDMAMGLVMEQLKGMDITCIVRTDAKENVTTKQHFAN